MKALAELPYKSSMKSTTIVTFPLECEAELIEIDWLQLNIKELLSSSLAKGAIVGLTESTKIP